MKENKTVYNTKCKKLFTKWFPNLNQFYEDKNFEIERVYVDEEGRPIIVFSKENYFPFPITGSDGSIIDYDDTTYESEYLTEKQYQEWKKLNNG